MQKSTGRLLALAAAVLFSTGGAGLKAEVFSVAQMSGLRSGIAAVALFLWLRGRVTISPATLVAGGLYAVTVTLFVAATKLTTAAAAIFLQSSAPLFIVLLGPSLLGERFRGRDLWYLAIAGAGLWLCFSGAPVASGTAPDPKTGNLLAAACSVTWALTLISLRHLERTRPGVQAGLAAALTGNAIACLIAVPFAWPLPSASPTDWATVLYLGVFQIAMAYWCLTGAVSQLPALEVSLLLLIEPVLNPVWTWMIRGEEPGRAVIAGGAIIVAATALRAVRTGSTPVS